MIAPHPNHRRWSLFVRWVVISPTGQFMRMSMARLRKEAIDAFMTAGYAQKGESWESFRREGFRTRRVMISAETMKP